MIALSTIATLRRAAPRIAVGALAAGMLLAASPAAADFRLCNNTPSRVGIAIGYKDNDGWATEGWWNLSARSCETLLRGTLSARYYYIYAVDYDRGGEWSGQATPATIVHGMLGFARNNATRREPTDLCKIVDEVLLLTEKDLSKHRVHVETRFTGEQEAEVAGEAEA